MFKPVPVIVMEASKTPVGASSAAADCVPE